ncbi:DDE-type integrase/transposase/recombinase [Pseudomonas sp. F1_0610]
MVMDLYSRKIISWAFSDRADSKLVRRALQLAIEKRRPKENLVLHSD